MGSKYTQDLLAPLVSSSTCMAELLAKLGLRPTGGNYRHLNARIRALGLSTSHFTGSNWTKGHTKETSDAIRRMAESHTIPNDQVFVENCPYSITGRRLTRRLLAEGRQYVCAICAICDWRGHRLTLHLDHVNGINNDHRRENLRFLCPNCHQQTDTWGNRNRRRFHAIQESEGAFGTQSNNGVEYLS